MQMDRWATTICRQSAHHKVKGEIMNPVKKAASCWIAVVAEHARKDLAHFEKLAASTISLETIDLARTGAEVSAEIQRRLENLQIALLCDAPPAELVTLMRNAGIEAIDHLVNAHADPVGAIDDGWTISEHIQATAAARVVQGSKWFLAEIEKATSEKATAPDVTDGSATVPLDNPPS
jgi:hypothetical protein